jgi:hypothetical protein
VPGEVSFYLDPSVSQPGNSVVINGPVAACTDCPSPSSQYFASAGSPAPFNGVPPVPYSNVFTPSPGNNFAIILQCPNACVCDATGLCATFGSPNMRFGLYPLCSSESK